MKHTLSLVVTLSLTASCTSPTSAAPLEWTTAGRNQEMPWWEKVHPAPTTEVTTGIAEPEPAQPTPTSPSVSSVTETTFIVLSDVLFAPDDDRIDAPGLSLIRDFADTVLAKPYLTVAVHGHTDCRGNDNDALSERRAAAGVSALTAAGINPDTIGTPQGHGCSRPAHTDPSLTNSERDRLNRRIEFVVTTEHTIPANPPERSTP